MYNKKLFSLVNLAFLSSTISAKIMTKNEVLNIDTSKYKDIKFDNMKECPDYSYDFWERDRCGFDFYCKDDTCASLSFANETSIEIPNKAGLLVKYITDTCSLTDIDSGFCNSEECTADSQCLSNKCVKNHCAFNEDNPIVHCEDAYQFNPFTAKSRADMFCGAPEGDKCSKDDDCSSRRCHIDVCEKQYRDHYFDYLGTILIYGGIFIVVCILICIFFCYKCCVGLTKSKKDISPA